MSLSCVRQDPYSTRVCTRLSHSLVAFWENEIPRVYVSDVIDAFAAHIWSNLLFFKVHF